MHVDERLRVKKGVRRLGEHVERHAYDRPMTAKRIRPEDQTQQVVYPHLNEHGLLHIGHDIRPPNNLTIIILQA